MSYPLYKLTFPSGLHLDAGSYGYETSEVMIHSDTLFSALCCCANLLEGDEGVEKLKEHLIISSAFPFTGDKLFFPKPLHLANPEFPAEHYDKEKAWRKVRFIEEGLLRQALAGSLKIEQTFEEEKMLKGCWFEGEPMEVYTTIEHPRIVIDRVTHQTTIFYFQEVHFNKGCGLFFLADWSGDEDTKKTYLAALRLLGDEGIGSDGTVGKGLFTLDESGSVAPFSSLSGNRFYLLSLYHPDNDEVQHIQPSESNYDILIRRGWVSNWKEADLRRKSVKMFTEGSVIAVSDLENINGSAPTVLENNELSIFRYGKALTF